MAGALPSRQTSVFLASLIGPVLAIAALGILFNPTGFVVLVSRLMSDQALIYLAAILELLGCAALLLVHNVWAADWRVLITLIGWGGAIEGAAWILVPEQLPIFYAPLLGAPAFAPVTGVAVLLIGAVLIYFGFFDKPQARRRK